MLNDEGEIKRKYPLTRLTFFGLEVHGDALLVPVDAEEVAAFLISEVVFYKRRSPMSRVVAGSGIFDLNDLGPEIAE